MKTRPRSLSRLAILAIAAWFSYTLAACGADESKSKSAEQVLKAGAAASNITPPIGLPIVGGFTPQPSEHVHDELHARALVLDNGTTRLALVVCDTLGIPRAVCDEAKKLIEQECGIPRQAVLISATHTHSSASLSNGNRLVQTTEFSEYQKFVIRRIVDGVRRAAHQLEPAQIAWGSIAEPSQVFNRRWYVLDPELATNPFGGVDKVRMNPPRGSTALARPAGPIDPEISFLSVRAADGRPLAVLANYSLHYVGGPGGQAYSADYFGVFAEQIGKHLRVAEHDPPFVGILSNGTSGDINNINFTEKSPPKYKPFEKTRLVADLVAQRVAEAHQGLSWQSWIPLHAAERELTLAIRQPTDEMRAYLKQVMAKPEAEARFHVRERDYAQRVAQLEAGPREVTVVLQALRLGELGIAAIPFEVFAEIGLEIKQKSPLGKTFTIELANGWYGYLPTPEQHAVGGYETWLGTNVVEIEASRKISAGVLELLGQVKKE